MTCEPAIYVQDTFTLDDGRVILTRPSKITQDDYDDMVEWFALILRVMKRSVVAGAVEPTP